MKKFMLSTATLLLASGLSMAQTSTPQPDPSAPSTQPAQTDVGQPTDTNEPVYSGCLSGSKDNYTLTTDDGKTFRLHSDKDINEHVGKRVEIRGSIKQEGADRPDASTAPAGSMQELDVADIKNLDGGNCPSSGAATPGATADQSASATQPTTSTESAPATSTETAPATSSEPSAAASSAPSTSTESQPATSTESSASSQTAPAPMTETQPSSAATTTTTTEQSSTTSTTAAPATEPAPSAAVEQPATSTESAQASDVQQPAADVNANQAAESNAAAADQSASSADQQSDQAALPQTASPLPLFLMLGLGSLGSGLVLRRK
jgi:hypothetical protein